MYPVIMLTAKGGGERTGAISAQLGADDCVTNPFSWRKTPRGCQAVLYRQPPLHGGAAPPPYSDGCTRCA